MTQGTENKPKRPLTRYLLILSLGINLSIAGLIAGAWFGGHGPGGHERPPHRAASGSLGMRPYVRALSDEGRAALRLKIEASADHISRSREDMRGQWRAVQDALTATPFDATQLARAFDMQRGTITQTMEVGQKALLEYLSQLSDQERMDYAKRLKKFGRRGKFRRN